MEIFQKHPRFLGMKFPEITKPETLEKRYLGKLSKKALSFLKSLLKMDPKQRLNTTEALNNPYFEGLGGSTTSTGPISETRIESAKVNPTTNRLTDKVDIIHNWILLLIDSQNTLITSQNTDKKPANINNFGKITSIERGAPLPNEGNNTNK